MYIYTILHVNFISIKLGNTDLVYVPPKQALKQIYIEHKSSTKQKSTLNGNSMQKR